MPDQPPQAVSPQKIHAYEHLTPDVVLDALGSVGLLGDGRLMALSSYENRVYQVHLEAPAGQGDAAGEIVVVKFYRPDRWTDAQIIEEHAFAAEMIPHTAMMQKNQRRAPMRSRITLAGTWNSE